MEPITIGEILEAVGARCWASPAIWMPPWIMWTRDSRKLHPGSLFLPLEGERFDGHSFINSALENGAAAA